MSSSLSPSLLSAAPSTTTTAAAAVTEAAAFAVSSSAAAVTFFFLFFFYFVFHDFFLAASALPPLLPLSVWLLFLFQLQRNVFTSVFTTHTHTHVHIYSVFSHQYLSISLFGTVDSPLAPPPPKLLFNCNYRV